MNSNYDISVSQSFVVAFSNGNMLTCLLKTPDLSNAAPRRRMSSGLGKPEKFSAFS